MTGEVWEITWGKAGATLVLVLGSGARAGVIRCVDLKTGEVNVWPRHMLTDGYGSRMIA